MQNLVLITFSFFFPPLSFLTTDNILHQSTVKSVGSDRNWCSISLNEATIEMQLFSFHNTKICCYMRC